VKQLEQTTKAYADIFVRDYGHIGLLDHTHPDYGKKLEYAKLLNQMLEMCYEQSRVSTNRQVTDVD
jgi:hypothetical protein